METEHYVLTADSHDGLPFRYGALIAEVAFVSG